MHTPELELDERSYEREHIDLVLAATAKNFSEYWKSFLSISRQKFEEAIKEWEDENPDYHEFLELDFLQEFEDDPNAFKGVLRSKCPIIRRSLNSPASEMKKYKKSFNLAKGRDLLSATLNIATFGAKYVGSVEESEHEAAKSVDDLGLNELLDERYGVYGAIGGGIRSQFLYSLTPKLFPLRSRAAVWALYFLSGKEDFGLEGDSEFLMINVEKSSTQQNYFYPYDLFAFYSLMIYKLVKEACATSKVTLDEERRYIYLNAFFNHVYRCHEDEVKLLKGDPEDDIDD